MGFDRAENNLQGKRVTWVGVLANGILIVFKLLAGIFGRSQAMIADAVHSVSDFFTDAVVLFGLTMGSKAPDANHHFGHARIETMAQVMVGVTLLGVGVYLGWGAAMDIYHHAEHHPNWLALIGAAVSIAVKEVMYHYTIRVGRRIKSPLVIANAWHHRSDALSSVAVLIGVGGALLNPQLHILDAVAALLVSAFIIKVGGEIVWKAAREMTDPAPSPKELDKIAMCIGGVAGVMRINELKVRIVGSLYAMHVCIAVDGSLTVNQGHAIALEVEKCLESEINRIGEVMVHVDPA